MRLAKLSFIAAVVLHAVLLLSANAGQAEAKAVVEDFHSALVEVMKEGGKLGFDGRYEKLEPVIKTTFDLPFIAKVAIGRYRAELDEAQEARLIEKFTELSVATYASRFDSYSGEAFEVTSTRELRRGRTVVSARLVKSSGEAIEFDYVLQQSGERWKIVNVVVDGVSDLSLKRAQYTSIIKDEGFDALIRKFEEKIRDYSKE